MRPSASFCATMALSSSESIRAILKLQLFFPGDLADDVGEVSRRGLPPAPPLVPIIIGMPWAIAAFSNRRRSRFMARRELSVLPEPR